MALVAPWSISFSLFVCHSYEIYKMIIFKYIFRENLSPSARKNSYFWHSFYVFDSTGKG